MEARKIIITGGATRIGAAIAETLAGPNKEIVIHYNKSKSKAENLRKKLQNCGAIYKKLPESKIVDVVSTELAADKAIGWMQGRMEFGPRALGCRSILANPCSPFMQKQLNLKVKYRESFRPFAPSVLREDVHKWFVEDFDSPYMLLVDFLKKDKRCQMTAKQ